MLSAWGRILTGSVRILSIEIARERSLSQPGCYAFGDTHLGGVTLSVRRGLCGATFVASVLQ
jgi:hypothetical protein